MLDKLVVEDRENRAFVFPNLSSKKGKDYPASADNTKRLVPKPKPPKARRSSGGGTGGGGRKKPSPSPGQGWGGGDTGQGGSNQKNH